MGDGSARQSRAAVPTSSVTCWKTWLGGDSAATSVATRRRAACSSASSRCDGLADGKCPRRLRTLGRYRGEEQRGERAGRDEELRGKQAVGDRVADERPVLCAVFQTVIEQTTRIAIAAPRGPSRAPPRAAPGRRRTARQAAAPAPPAPPARRTQPPPSTRSRRRIPAQPVVAQVSRAGATTSTPAASPKVHVRKTRPRSSVPITSPRRSDVGPNAALTSAATTAQTTSANTSNVRASSPAPARQPPQQQRGDHQGERVADRLAQDGSQRRREIREQQIADHDARPQADAVQEEHGETEPGRRPHGRNGTIEIGELEAQPPGQVVRTGDQRDRAHVQRDAAVPGAAQAVDPPSKRRPARVSVADETRVHGHRGSLEPQEGPRTDSAERRVPNGWRNGRIRPRLDSSRCPGGLPHPMPRCPRDECSSQSLAWASSSRPRPRRSRAARVVVGPARPSSSATPGAPNALPLPAAGQRASTLRHGASTPRARDCARGGACRNRQLAGTPRVLAGSAAPLSAPAAGDRRRSRPRFLRGHLAALGLGRDDLGSLHLVRPDARSPAARCRSRIASSRTASPSSTAASG